MREEYLEAGNRRTQHDTEILEEVTEDIPGDISMFSSGGEYTLFYSKSKGWFACECFMSSTFGKLSENFIFDEKSNGFTPIPSLARIVPLCFTCDAYSYAIVSTEGRLYGRGCGFGPELREIELSVPAKYAASDNHHGWIVLLENGDAVF